MDSIVETRIFEYHVEKRGEHIMTKDKLLAVGEQYGGADRGRPGRRRRRIAETGRHELITRSSSTCSARDPGVRRDLVVITVRNPVHAALFLVLAFFTSAVIWLLLEAEFLAIALVLVYVGAVMVLFLFVVMMLDINIAHAAGGLHPLPAGGSRWLRASWPLELALVVGSRALASAGARTPAPRADAARLQQHRGARRRLLYTDLPLSRSRSRP